MSIELKADFTKEFGPDIKRGIGRSQEAMLVNLTKLLYERERGRTSSEVDLKDKRAVAKYIREKLYRTFYDDDISDSKLDAFVSKLESRM